MNELLAETFSSDSRVLRAKQLILEALEQHQAEVTGIRAPDEARKARYDEMVAEFGTLRAGSLFYPYLGSGFGKGPFVECADGSIKYDFISGIGVHHWGHAHPEIIEALLEAAVRDTVQQGNLQQNVESVSLARLLIEGANRRGSELRHCFLTSSGAMANENALKLAFHAKPGADRVLAFEGGFAGRTLAMSCVTDRPSYRVGLPITLNVDYIPFFDPDRPEDSVTVAQDRLKILLERYPGRYAAMILEPVQGEGGFLPGRREFFAPIMERLQENDVAVIVDEIQTFGRTTELFAYQYFGLDRYVDIVTLGKLSQVCATLFRDDYKPGPGLLSQTFTSSTSAIFAGRVIVESLLNDGFLGHGGKIARLGSHIEQGLTAMSERHPDLIRGPFGIGAMVAFTPLDGSPDKVKQFLHALFDAGVIAFLCGSRPTRARFLLPVGAITTDHIDEVLSITEQTLIKVAGTD
jgi:acetylornithine aminotransferase